MRRFILLLSCLAALVPTTSASAAGPRNPYAGFNLSGINYGAQQWERAQRQGKRVWPYYNTPSRSPVRGSGATVGGTVTGRGGAFIGGGRSSPSGRRRR